MSRPATERRQRLAAVGEGSLLILVLGSTLVIAKAAVLHVGPLSLAALRYCSASVVLLPLALQRERWHLTWPREVWARIVAIGLGFYALGNGALFVGLQYVPAATASLVLGLVPIVVLTAGILWLGERPTRGQLLGMALAVVGTVLFFAHGLGPGEPLGLAVLAAGLLGNASLGILGRPLASSRQISPLLLTAMPLAIGGLVVLPLALATEGLPRLSPGGRATVGWLALVNTAFAYFLYNLVLRTLAAFELSVLTSLTPAVTALGAWLFLAQPLLILQLAGIGLTAGGVVLVQLTRPSR